MAFNEMKDRFSNELRELESHKSDLNTFSKDMDMQVEHCMKTISDIGKMYSNADAAIQREIVGSIFPEYIVFSDKKVRTVRMNEVIKLLCPSIAKYETKKRGQNSEKSALSSGVDYTFEISNLDLVRDLSKVVESLIDTNGSVHLIWLFNCINKSVF